MNLDKFPIARYNKKNIYWKDIKTPIRLKDDEKTYESLPYIIDEKQRVSTFISAASGAGKSMEACRLVKEMLKTNKYKDNKVVLLTLTEEADEAYESLDYFKLPLEEAVLTQEPSFYRNTIFIADDWESGHKEIVDMIHGLIKRLLERGRKLNIGIIICCHQTQNYNLTRDIIFECQDYVLFPIAGMNSILKFCKAYLDMDNKELKALQKDVENDRKFHIRKSVPRYLVADKVVRKI